VRQADSEAPPAPPMSPNPEKIEHFTAEYAISACPLFYFDFPFFSIPW
jgi:hypothetical protein